jgi:probable rRNA maturation factor
MRVNVAGRHAPLSRIAVVRAAETVLAAEHRNAELSISFLGRQAMRDLNLQWTGRDEITDVLAFPLRTPQRGLMGDIYICPWAASRAARERGLPLRQELNRLIVHGVLHVLGYEHPEGPERDRSPMWKRQERLVRRLR